MTGLAFVLCSARSRSTLLTAMLGCHPRVFATPELLLFTVPTLGGLLLGPAVGYPEDLIRRRASGVLRLLAQVKWGDQSAESIQQARRWIEQHAEEPTEWLIREIRATCDADVVVEKSPDTTSTPERLRRCAAADRESRFLLLIRDPWSVIESMWRHWRVLTPQADQRGLMQRCTVACFTSTKNMLEARERWGDERWLVVRSEAVVATPALVCAEVTQHLGLTSTAAELDLMQRPEKWLFANPGAGGELGGGDPIFLADPRLRLGENETERRARCIEFLHDSPRVIDAVDDLSRNLGYEVA